MGAVYVSAGARCSFRRGELEVEVLQTLEIQPWAEAAALACRPPLVAHDRVCSAACGRLQAFHPNP